MTPYIQDKTFYFPLRIYYEDTDAGGIVYHANYLKFMERARTEMLLQLGLNQTVLRQEHQLLFVVRNIDIHYKMPGYLEDQLEVTARLETMGGSSFVLHQSVRRGQDVLSNAQVVVVGVDSQSMRPKRLPEDVCRTLANFNQCQKCKKDG